MRTAFEQDQEWPLCMHFSPSYWAAQLSSHRMDFDEILYLIIFQKSVEKSQVLLKSDTNNGYLIWRPK